MSTKLETQITGAASTARNLLGQLGPLVWALDGKHDAVGNEAAAIAVDPRGRILTDPQADPDQSIQQRATADVSALLSGAEGRGGTPAEILSSDGLRDAISRSIVVYAVAALERFVDDGGERVWADLSGRKRACDERKRGPGWPLSFGRMVDCLKDVDVSLYGCERYPQAALLALYRHKIVHVDGRTDHKLLDQVADIGKETGRQLGFRLSCDGSSAVWDPCGGEKLRDAWTCKRISLAIDEVAPPLLRDTQAFVAEAESVLLDAARKMAEQCR